MQKVTINGVSLAYELSGSGKETVIFLNGIAMSIAHWNYYVQALSPDYRCLCHDFRGQIMSDMTGGPYSFNQHADDLAALMRTLGIAKAHLVGTSYGSEVAMVFALAYPDMVTSLTLIDGVSESDQLLKHAINGWRAAAMANPIAFYRNLIPWTYSTDYIARNRTALDSREAGIAAFPKEYFTSFIALCDAFLALDITAELPRIACPTLVMVGDKDILKPIRYSELIARKIPGAELVILPGLGHASAVEAPAVVLAPIKKFLKESAL